MKTVLVDASSAILLYKAGLFEAMSGLYRLVMVAAVVQEVTRTHYPGAVYFQTALADRRIARLDLKTTVDDAGALPSSLGAGEKETLLAFAPSQALFILIDDAKGARVCRHREIPYINALLCPELLYGVGRLQGAQRDNAFDRLLTLGRYGPDVVVYARNCRGNALAHFYP